MITRTSLRYEWRGIGSCRRLTTIRSIRLLFMMAVFVLIALIPQSRPASGATPVIIPVAVTVCTTCNNSDTLAAAALTYANTWIAKTPTGYVGIITWAAETSCTSQNGANTILVVSSAAPLSGAYWPCVSPTHGGAKILAIPIASTGDSEVISGDNIRFHRSAKTQTIVLPSSLNLVTSDAMELITGWMAGNIPLSGPITFNLWHALTSLNIGAVAEGVFTNPTSGLRFTIWSNDTIQVRDSDGNTALFKWIPSVSPPWVLVPGSIRDKNGNPVEGAPSNSPSTGGTAQPIGFYSVQYPDGPIIEIAPWYDNTTPSGTITVGDPIDDPGSVPALQCASAC